MAERKSLIELKAFRRRGDIYRWLREHYEQVLHDTVHLERPWRVIADEIANDGVAGARGGRPSGHAAERVWKRVCRDVAVQQAREEEERRAAAYGVRIKGGGDLSQTPRPLRPRLAEPSGTEAQARSGPAVVLGGQQTGNAGEAPEDEMPLSLKRLMRTLGANSGVVEK